MDQCSIQGCRAAPAPSRSACFGHLENEDFADVARRMQVAGEDVDARRTTLLPGRVLTLLRGLPGSSGLRQRVDLTESTIRGDLTLSDLHLRAPVEMHAASIEGTLRFQTCSGLRHVVTGDYDRPPLRAAALEIAECDASPEALTLERFEVEGELRVERTTLRLLTLRAFRAANLRIVDVQLGACDAEVAAVSRVDARRVNVTGGMRLAGIYAAQTRLVECRFGSWANIATSGSIDANSCYFEGPLRLSWWSARRLADLLNEPFRVGPADFVDVPAQDDAKLSFESVRMDSTAHLRWCSGEVSLFSVVFSDASTLDADAEADGPPRLVDVTELDGEDLQIRRVDVSRCRLSEAASLGAIELDHINVGLGGAGFTMRKYIADEGTRSWPWSRPDDFKLRAQRLAATYRDLRTSSENVRDYIAANDLHYGERLWQRKAVEPPAALRPKWIWLSLYALVGYGVRPWRPLAWLVTLVFVSALLFGAVDGLQRDRVVDGTAAERSAVLCQRGDPTTPERRQTVRCDADFGERVEFAVRSTTSIVRPVGGFETRGAGVGIEMATRLLAALLFGLFVLAIRNRVRR